MQQALRLIEAYIEAHSKTQQIAAYCGKLAKLGERVPIYTAWQASKTKMSLAAYKALLWQWHTQHEIYLSPCDMPQAMPGGYDVLAKSEINGAHFIDLSF
jgi:hypothetical protein